VGSTAPRGSVRVSSAHLTSTMVAVLLLCWTVPRTRDVSGSRRARTGPVAGTHDVMWSVTNARWGRRDRSSARSDDVRHGEAPFPRRPVPVVRGWAGWDASGRGWSGRWRRGALRPASPASRRRPAGPRRCTCTAGRRRRGEGCVGRVGGRGGRRWPSARRVARCPELAGRRRSPAAPGRSSR
jgi:hypothetical protein